MRCAECGNDLPDSTAPCRNCGAPPNSGATTRQKVNVVYPLSLAGSALSQTALRLGQIASALMVRASPTLRRIEGLLLNPVAEWRAIAAERWSVRQLYLRYLAPVAAFTPLMIVLSFLFAIGRSYLGVGDPIGPVALSLGDVAAAASAIFCLSLLGPAVISYFVNYLSEAFGTEADGLQALKVGVYSATPALIGEAFLLLPWGLLIAILGVLYSFHLAYLSLPIVMRCPRERAAGYAFGVILAPLASLIVALILFGGFADVALFLTT